MFDHVEQRWLQTIKHSQNFAFDAVHQIPHQVLPMTRHRYMITLAGLDRVALWDDEIVTFNETLGVLAHRGGLLVERPELSVGVVRAVSRPTGVELELLARRPLDRRSAAQRQADIRSGRGTVPAAPRQLLPAYDEGMDLRVGWLDRDHRPHWAFGSSSSSSGDHFQGTMGPSLRTVVTLPPLYDHVSIVLAWPEIGFPETVVRLSLPDQATVERETMSVWDAPTSSTAVPTPLRHHVGDLLTEELPVEAGHIVAGPQVLSRGMNAAVVLTRLTAIGSGLSLELSSLARGATAGTISGSAFPPGQRTFGRPDDAEQIRNEGPGASVAITRNGDAFWVQPHEGSSAGGPDAFASTYEFILSRPDGGVLNLVVAWPSAALPDVRASIPLNEP